MHVANSDGGGGRALASPDDVDIGSKDPTWSPDGRRIAFFGGMDVGGKLGLVSLADGDVETLGLSGRISHGEVPESPTWCRGSGISASRPYSDTGRRISQFVVPKRFRACGLAWSPDGDRLLLSVHHVRPGHGGPQLYTVDPYGKRWHHLRAGIGPTSCNVSWR